MTTSLGDQALSSVQALADAYEIAVTLGGIPFATEFRLPMKNLEKEWYAAHSRWQYPDHPPAFDWNLETGGDSDLGEPLVAPWSGIVLSANDWGGGTGKVIQILGITKSLKLVVWAGWHLHDMFVSEGQVVPVGCDIGEIGNADGRYSAHLHEQICVVGKRGVPLPHTYVGDIRYNWRDCAEFYVECGISQDLIDECVRYG